MPYVRTRGQQVAIVHGRRHPETKQVKQEVLFAFYSRGEAEAAIGRQGPAADKQFRRLMEERYPELRFPWPRLHQEIEKRLDVLPVAEASSEESKASALQEDLLRFARRLALLDPGETASAAAAINASRDSLLMLREWIDWRIDIAAKHPARREGAQPYRWETRLPTHEAPHDLEELAAGHYERHEDAQAEAMFKFLVAVFPGYAEGWNYMGLISLRASRYEEAIARFTQTVELGRKALPKRVAKSRWWSDLDTRPFMRGLNNLALAFQQAGRYRDAIAVATRLERECHDDFDIHAHYAAAHLCLGEWDAARSAARRIRSLAPSESLIAAFAAYELGEYEDAAAAFVHAALNGPRGVAMVLGQRFAHPSAYDEIEDHNAGVHMLRTLDGYLSRQSPAAGHFFKALWKAMLPARKELEGAVAGWRGNRSGDRTDYDQMMKMRSLPYSRQLAAELLDAGGIFN